MPLLVFYLRLGWLPGSGRIAPYVGPPATVTGLCVVDAVITGMVARMTRSSMLELLRRDFIKTARAKGLAEGIVLYKHALRNAILPAVTLAGMVFGYSLGGSVLVESIYSWPGLGKYAVHAITYLDFPAVMGVTLLVALLFVLINLVVDLSYFALDPRIQ